jgi:hypothetical protein
MTHDVFVSYSQKDKATADAIVARLEQDKSRCWIAPRDILPGTTWGGAIVDAIEASKVMVLVLSGNSNRSRQVLREVERAVAGDVIVLPFRIEQAEPTGALAYYLGTEHWLDAITPPIEQHIDHLSGVVQLLLSGDEVAHKELDTPPAALAASRSGRWRWIAAVTILPIAALVTLLIVLSTADGDPEQTDSGIRSVDSTQPAASGTGPSTPAAGAATTTTTTTTSPTTVPVPIIGLEEIGRYQPVDPDPSDLVAPGPITDFDIEGSVLVYANGVSGVTRAAIDDPANPRPIETFGTYGATAIASADDHLVATVGDFGAMYALVFAIDGSGGPDIALDAAGSNLFSIEVADDFAYAASHDYVGIIDISEPAEAELVFEWIPPSSTGNPARVYVRNGVGYFAAGWDGLYIFDVSNPAAPTLSGHWVSPSWVIDVVVIDEIAYLTLGEGASQRST